MTNGHFSLSLHVLTLLACTAGWQSSEWLAGSINIHPVQLRNALGQLRKHGLIRSKEGKNGGIALAQPPGEITLAAIYAAVQQAPLLGTAKNTPNPDCPVGQQINRHLEQLYQQAEQALLDKLGEQTLEAFCSRFSLPLSTSSLNTNT